MKIKNLKLKIVFFGSSKFVIPIIEVLRENFDLVFVVTTENLQTDPVISYCIKSKVHHYVVIDFRKRDIIRKLKETNPDIGVLTYFGAIVPKEVLNLFPKGILNIHPSLLPKYRGPTPAQTAILNGDKTTGVTIIKIDDEIDHGKIFVQKSINIADNDTASSLHEKLFKLGAEMLIPVIKDYLKGSLKPQEQDHSKATFTIRLTREDGCIDLSKVNGQMSKVKIDRMIRAYHPWPGVWTKWKMENGKWKILKLLPDKKIQVEGRKPMSYKDFMNGYPEAKPWLEKLLGPNA